MSDDVWAGIPVELREKVEAHASSRGIAWYVNPGEVTAAQKATADLCDALRSLLSRLQEAEKDTQRLNWMERQDWSANGVMLGKLALRRAVDQALELERANVG